MPSQPVIITLAKENQRRLDVADTRRCAGSVRKALVELGYQADIFEIERKDFSDATGLRAVLSDRHPVGVFNLFEGYSSTCQSEADFVRILDESGIPYTGNSSETLALCLNKVRTKEKLRQAGIDVPSGIFIQDARTLDEADVSYPAFVKPCCEDASIGIDRESLIMDAAQLKRAVSRKLEHFPQGLLIEEFVGGPEYSVGLIGNYPFEVLAVSVIDYSRSESPSPFITYHSKWESRSIEYKLIIPLVCDAGSCPDFQGLTAVAVSVGKLFGCRGYYRVDFRKQDGKNYVLDVNPNPDINEDSGFCRQAYKKGYTYVRMIEKIMATAFEP